MAYIETHQSLFTHRKTLRLARLLSMDKFSVVGRLTAFWCWAIDNVPDGAIATSDADILADVMEWKGDPHALISALISSGFLEDAGSTYRIHDWMDYAGRLIEKRKTDAERKRSEREAASGKKNVQRTSKGYPADGAGTVPYRTQPHPTMTQRDEDPCISSYVEVEDEMLSACAQLCVPDVAVYADETPGVFHGTSSPEQATITQHTSVDVARVPAAAGKPSTIAPLTSQRSAHKRPRTTYTEDSPEMRLACYLKAKLEIANPDVRIPEDLNGWAASFGKAMHDDQRTYDGIRRVIDYAVEDPFWLPYIASAAKVCEKYATLAAQSRAKQPQTEGEQHYGDKRFSRGNRGEHRGYAHAAGYHAAETRGYARTSTGQPTAEQRIAECERNKRDYGFYDSPDGYDRAS